MPESESIKIVGLSSDSVSQGMGGEKEAEVLLHKVDSHAEDVDMDVDMEVDEETVAGQTVDGDLSSAECPAPIEQIIQPNLSSLECPVPLDESSIPPPPPPDEEWIPPPPPDNGPVPPPPPEEPPAPAPFPPTYDITLPPYQDQYNLGHTLPTYEYYAPVAGEITNANYYAQADGSHIAEPQPPSYYEPAVASAFPEVAADVNPAEPVSYYDLSSGADPHAPVVMSAGSGYMLNLHLSVIIVLSLNQILQNLLGLRWILKRLPYARWSLHLTCPQLTSKSETAIVQAASVASTVQAAGTALGNGSATSTPSSSAPKKLSKGQSP